MWGRSSTRTDLGRLLVLVGLGLASQGRALGEPMTLKVAAAADLAVAFKEVGAAFEKASGERVTFSFGSTGLLARQIGQGAPFDVFAAANVSYADDLIKAGACLADSKILYAKGQIVLWSRRDGIKLGKLSDVTGPQVRKLAIANPEHAPYGQAARAALQKSGLWDAVRPKLVFGENVQQTLTFAQTGNVEAAIVALSLATVTDGNVLPIDPGLHPPIDQAMAVCGRDARRREPARRFVAFVGSPAGRAIMRRYGFLLPGEKVADR